MGLSSRDVIGLAEIRSVVARFALAGECEFVERLQAGHINESYVVTLAPAPDRRVARYLLQRLNPRVFSRPFEVIENIERATQHVSRRLAAGGVPDIERRALRLVPALDGRFACEEGGATWRMYDFIDGACTCLRPHSPRQAASAARAFGEFHRLLADYGGPRLHETIPDFHNTPARFAALAEAIADDAAGRLREAAAQIDFTLARCGLASALLDLQRSGAAPERIVHNDAKIANVLFDERTGEALCVVDLDTVMPGLSLFDFGDMVRSMACPAAEDERDASRVRVEPQLFEAVTRGYLSAAGDLLTWAERQNLVTAGLLITLEQGVRFLTDYLRGDVYYRTGRPGQNLDRCRVQFALVESIESDRAELERICATGDK